MQDDMYARALEGPFGLIAFVIVVGVESGRDQARERVSNLQGHSVAEKLKVGHSRQTIILDLDEPAGRFRTDREDIDSARAAIACTARAALTDAATILA